MNILYVNHYAGTLKMGMEFRPYYMSREWNKSNNNVLIVASSESHVRAKQPVFDGSFKEENIEGVNYLWCKTPKYDGNGVGRVINIFAFLFRLMQKLFFFMFKFKPDIVIASSTYPLDIFPSWIIARLTGAKLIFEVHDLWPLSPIELGGISKWHPFMMLLQFGESFACRMSDAIVSMLPKAKDHLQQHGMRPEKFTYVPNGIDVAEWRFHESHQCLEALKAEIEEAKAKGIFTIAYLGAHGIANALDNFLSAAEILKDQKVLFFLVGNGPEKEALIQLAKSKSLTNVRFIDPIKKNEIPSVTNQFSCLYIGLQRQSLFRFGISPNKMMDYMAAGRPVISAIEAGNDPVTDANCGVSIVPENPMLLAEEILKMSQLSKEQTEALGANGKRYVENNHDYRVLGQRFLDVMTKISRT